MGILKNPILQKTADFFRPLPGDSPCLGVALGRWEASLLESQVAEGKNRIRCFQTHNFPTPLWEGAPRPEAAQSLVSFLAPLLAEKDVYRTLQISLPDAAARWEVFELDRIPPAGPPLERFLHWRFNSQDPEKSSFVFATQFLGAEKGKKLLLGTALEKTWLEWLQEALDRAGARVSFLDTAFRFRFNLFQETFLSQGPGALVSLEGDYWTLLIWDRQARPRFQRSKWWRNRIEDPKELPLEELTLEVERTIRSFVHSGADRSVDHLNVLAPEAWMDRVLEAFRKPTQGRVTGLDLDEYLCFEEPSSPLLPPSLAATAVRQ